MEYLQAFILGIIQGITEFLPISSTAHLHVAAKLFGWSVFDNKPFVASIQFGSVTAVILYFWSDIVKIFVESLQAYRAKNWKNESWQLLVGTAIGTMPILLVGFVIRKVLNAEDSWINSVLTIAIASIVMSMLLAVAEVTGKRERDFDRLTIRDGVLMGCGQMLALVPGVSRSGSTLTTGLFLGLNRNTAARFSFLMGIPALTIATGYEFFKEAIGRVPLDLVAVGTVSAFIFSYIAIAGLLRFFQTQSTWIFVWYRLGFGSALLGAIAAGRFQ